MWSEKLLLLSFWQCTFKNWIFWNQVIGKLGLNLHTSFRSPFTPSPPVLDSLEQIYQKKINKFCNLYRKKHFFFCSAVVKETRQIAAVWGISISQNQLTPIQLHLIFSDVVFLACCHVSTRIFPLRYRDFPFLPPMLIWANYMPWWREREKKNAWVIFAFFVVRI